MSLLGSRSGGSSSACLIRGAGRGCGTGTLGGPHQAWQLREEGLHCHSFRNWAVESGRGLPVDPRSQDTPALGPGAKLCTWEMKPDRMMQTHKPRAESSQLEKINW